MTDLQSTTLAQKVVNKALDLMAEGDAWTFNLEIMDDLRLLQRSMTPEAARQITEGLDLESGMPDEDVAPEEYAMDVLNQVGRNAGLSLQTQTQGWEAQELDEILHNEQSQSTSSRQTPQT